ncbi:MAG: GDSL-type esterase/lipase family protein [Kangiellaceae bacterium]|nr:GDSL-type esterase/lipase family protein [Kangiellaceae bacterium]MCW8997620.1 GDSL-type esterase/lipase family protein [Kangiellaceae bacterium]
MKRVLCLILIFSFISFTYGVVTVQYRIFPYDLVLLAKNTFIGKSEPRSARYLHKTSLFEEFGRCCYDIVFIGDSITEDADWEDIFPNYRIANRGIGGDTSDGVLERMDSIISTKANKAFIMVGVNDFSKVASFDSVFDNYQKIIVTLLANDFNVYVQSTLNVGTRGEKFNNSIDRLNERLKSLADQKNKVVYIDLNKSLTANGAVKSDFTEDGVHLNANGYRAWKEAIQDYLLMND